MMNETAQETTAEMALLVEHESQVLDTLVLPGENKKCMLLPTRYMHQYEHNGYIAITVHVC